MHPAPGAVAVRVLISELRLVRHHPRHTLQDVSSVRPGSLLRETGRETAPRCGLP